MPTLATDTLVWCGRPLTQKVREKGSGDQPIPEWYHSPGNSILSVLHNSYIDTETEGSTFCRNPMALGCSILSAARVLLGA